MFVCLRNKVLYGVLVMVSLFLIWHFNGIKEALQMSFKEVDKIENGDLWPTHQRDEEMNSTFLVGETTCSCDRNLQDRNPTEDLTTCSREAATRGYHQRVLAFSFYGDISQQIRSYFQGIENNAVLAAHLYQGWTMRVYHDMDPNSPEICRLYCIYPFLDFCNAHSIPGFGNVMTSQHNAWRFLPMCDPTVDVFVSRDLDSLISQREKAAVDQWLKSNLTFHVMRDHKFHLKSVMAGMWGAQLTNNREKLKWLCFEMMSEKNGEKGNDQEILKKYLWSIMKYDVLQHDSYRCEYFRSHGHMEGWPTQRLLTPYNFVGARLGKDKVPIKDPCPMECRSEEHKDWTTC